MKDALEIIELRHELERVKLLLQNCNGDIIRYDRELKKLILVSELLYTAVEVHSFGMPGVIQSLPKYKSVIENAKNLIK